MVLSPVSDFQVELFPKFTSIRLGTSVLWFCYLGQDCVEDKRSWNEFTEEVSLVRENHIGYYYISFVKQWGNLFWLVTTENFNFNLFLLQMVVITRFWFVSVCFLLKIATPARYTVTLGGTSFTVKYLRSHGYMSTPPPVKGYLQDRMEETKELITEKMEETKDRLTEKLQETKEKVSFKKKVE